MLPLKLIFLTAVVVSHVGGHIAYWNHGNYLSPVQSLYVKPSADGTTGDLYMAATEDNAVKQWLTDKPVNFLSTAQHQALPAYATQLPREDIVVTTQKRAVITSPTIKYSYAYPGTSDGTPIPYPYAITVTSSAKPTEGTTECTEGASPAPAYPQYAPFQYYYPQMLAAFAHAMNTMKDAGAREQGEGENANTVPAWPSYAYPAFQYVMVDPSSWAQSQNQSSSAASSSSAESTATTSPANKNETSDALL